LLPVKRLGFAVDCSVYMDAPRIRLTVAWKFFLVLLVMAPLMVGVAVVGLSGLTAVQNESQRLRTDNLRTSLVTGDLNELVGRAQNLSFELLISDDQERRDQLRSQLDRRVIPQVESTLATLERLHAGDGLDERAPVRRLRDDWSRFLRLLEAPVLRERRSGATPRQQSFATRVAQVLSPFGPDRERLDGIEQTHARAAGARADRAYSRSRTLMLLIAGVALACGLFVGVLLVRNVVPRLRRYSRFATAVTGGDLSRRLIIRGGDELARLGTALNEMVDRRAADEQQAASQAEFVAALQVSETETEAHDLLRRQVERSIEGSAVVVLNRNNSEDRLQATTPVAADSPVGEGLVDASPRSCLAIRLSRTHSQGSRVDPLMQCELCGKTGGEATCEPLLVAGEVIGSVLVEHPVPLDERQAQSARVAVAQAAPVLGNLRNLAFAQARAATDALTGLPNKRTATDTIKRMVAHADRTHEPLAVLMLDLDHFKQINDRFGHGSGDDVLAAVGSTLSATVRTSDFASRYGGEEFLVILPATGRDEAAVVAEKVRAAIARISVPGVEREISASIGVAVRPDHGLDSATLVRDADRALYTAKKNGRNRVVLAAGQAVRDGSRVVLRDVDEDLADGAALDRVVRGGDVVESEAQRG
jgi:diguanylate cyclase (GGDEF)-like protein